MRKDTIKNVLSVLVAVLAMFTMVGCGDGGGDVSGKATPISIILEGWTNTPTDSKDPYRKWVADNYDLDVTLNASSDMDNSVLIAFQSTNKPDILSFPRYPTFLKIKAQDVLLDDWTPYLDKMPNFKKIVMSEAQQFTRNVLTVDNKLTALWSPANPPTWSLKIREDWANEYRATTTPGVNYPAGNTATKGGPWNPDTPEDLLNFARWIKVAKNSGGSLDCFGFSTAGEKTSFGTLETWMPLMWGRVSVAPYGFYVDENNQIQFSTTDGTLEPYLNYLRTIVDEKLIDPNWYSQALANDKRTTEGKIGIQWYTGTISSATQTNYNAGKSESEKVDTTDWWETYPLPVATSNTTRYAGYMAGIGLAGNIITVSKKTAMNEELMDKICAFLDDLYTYYDEASDTFVRGRAYDALRWGIGIEKDAKFLNIENTNLVYCNTKGVTEKAYREEQVGAWDWGAWFSSTNDGVVQGTTPDITSIVLKVAEHDMKTATFKATPQVGEFLSISSELVNQMKSDMIKFQYEYVTRATSESVSSFNERWKTSLGGLDMMTNAAEQYKALGLM